MSGYEDVYRASTEDREGFWLQAAEALDWRRPPTKALDDSSPPFHRWFPDGEINVAHNALDRHVEAGHGGQPALIYDSPVTGAKRTFTYARLRDEVATFAGALRDLGVGRGDRVVIYMPMVPEAVIAMLACARLGAVHSVVFGGFAARELAVRIDDAAPKVVVSASCGIEGKRVIEYKPLLDKAIDLSVHKPAKRVILQRPQAMAALGPDDVDWAGAVAAVTSPAGPVPVMSTDPLYVLYTSGTTGKPKGVVRDSGGYATALAWSMPNVYDVGPGQAIFTASDVGWVVGHSYIVYAPLLAGATTILYEGKPVGTPDAGQFWRVISEYGVRSMFTAPTAFRALKEDPNGEHARKYDLSRLKYLFLAGERLDPETYRWASGLLRIPVIDHWWQTETGWPIVANPAGIELLPVKPGSPTRPLPGWDIQVLGTDGKRVPAGEDGAIVAKLPLPPGAFTTLWQDDERFVESYMSAFEGYYLTGDGGRIDEDGYVFVMGRTDDVINVAGHRLSTGGMEEVLAAHPDVAECAVIGVADQLKGQVPRGLVVLKAGIDAAAEGYADRLRTELVQMVRDQIGAVASLKEIAIVPALPKTRSGKILRKTMRGIADGLDEPTPATIDDATVLDALRPILRRPQ